MTGALTHWGACRAVSAGVGENVTAATACYLGLSTALPGSPESASLADYQAEEITGVGDYSRQAATWTACANSGGTSTLTNDAAIEYGPFSSDPPEVTHAFLCTTSIGTTGNVMAHWTLDTPRDAANGDMLRFGSADLSMAVGPCA